MKTALSRREFFESADRPENLSIGPPQPPEPYIPGKQAADILGLRPWKVYRAIKTGIIPSYQLLNSRRLVKLSEVIAAIEASRVNLSNGDKK
jgi:hypothetical protein